MATASDQVSDEIGLRLGEANELEGQGRTLEAIDALTRANRAAGGEPVLERRLVELRHLAFDELPRTGGFTDWPVAVSTDEPPGPPQVPELEPSALTAEEVRLQISSHGCVLVRHLFSPTQVASLVEGIDRAIEVRATGPESEVSLSTGWFKALKLPPPQAKSLGRNWVGASGGVLALDSPTMLFRLLEFYEEVGLRTVLTDYLGERPVLGANKTTLRRVPVDANADWHQDGAFLGPGIRTLNVWIALSDCGIDAPGLDIVPRRFDTVQETGTGGAIFDWAVGPEVVAGLADRAPVERPVFRAGDCVLFDELCLHRTALEPTMMNPRYAIESWFFAPSCYPGGQVPLVW